MIHEKMPKKEQSGGCGSGGSDKAQQQEMMVKDALSKIKNKLLVMSGKGGVGKSSIAANLAVSLANKGFKVGLMDVDIHGPSIAQIMGMKGLLDITEDQRLKPVEFGDNLKVVSMQSLMQDEDQAVIWRGPAKGSMIQQFIGVVKWDELDFLVIDAPPGTGDEPLTVVQTIPEARPVIVTTPQNVALADVRKSINFCKTVNLDPIGLVENMGPYDCPHCGKTISLFKSNGGEPTAKKMGIPFLGTIPFDPDVVAACDDGTPIAGQGIQTDYIKAFDAVVEKIVKSL